MADEQNAWSTSDPTEILEHIKTNIATNQGIFLGESHGNVPITHWLATFVPHFGIDVIFVESAESPNSFNSPEQSKIDAYQNLEGERHDTPEHRALRETYRMTPDYPGNWTRCPGSWPNAESMTDEIMRVYDACTDAGIKIVAIDCTREFGAWGDNDGDGRTTMDCWNGEDSNDFWAREINEYLADHNDHKFVIWGGAMHGTASEELEIDGVANSAVNFKIYQNGDDSAEDNPKLTVEEYQLLPATTARSFGLSYPTDEQKIRQCGGEIYKPGSFEYTFAQQDALTGLGAYETSPCINLRPGRMHEHGGGSPFSGELDEAHYFIFLNYLNEAGDEVVGYDCQPITQSGHLHQPSNLSKCAGCVDDIIITDAKSKVFRIAGKCYVNVTLTYDLFLKKKSTDKCYVEVEVLLNGEPPTDESNRILYLPIPEDSSEVTDKVTLPLTNDDVFGSTIKLKLKAN